MSRGINKVILLGNLGRDPEVRYSPSGMAVASTSLATSRTWKDRQTGENQEKTEWHRLKFFGRLAEIVEKYVQKGSQIYVEGRLETNKWQDQQGQDRYTTEVVVSEMQMLGSRSEGNYTPKSDDEPRFGKPPSRPEPDSPFDSSRSTDSMDDDIPF